jgi:hypothetical protein
MAIGSSQQYILIFAAMIKATKRVWEENKQIIAFGFRWRTRPGCSGFQVLIFFFIY